MQIIIKSKNFKLTDDAKNYIEKKINKLSKYFDNIIETQVELNYEKTADDNYSKKIEVIIFASGRVIKAKESSSDIFSAVEGVINKLEKQIKKYKEKLKHIDKTSGKISKKILFAEEKSDTKEMKITPQIIRTKMTTKPMDEEEACHQMRLMASNFLVFLNSKTEKVNVMYLREDGNYGLIEPEI